MAQAGDAGGIFDGVAELQMRHQTLSGARTSEDGEGDKGDRGLPSSHDRYSRLLRSDVICYCPGSSNDPRAHARPRPAARRSLIPRPARSPTSPRFASLPRTLHPPSMSSDHSHDAPVPDLSALPRLADPLPSPSHSSHPIDLARLPGSYYRALVSIRERLPKELRTPKVAIVCGSGLQGLAEVLEDTVLVSYSDIDGFGESTGAWASGHFLSSS